jgi:hypothetical protein
MWIDELRLYLHGEFLRLWQESPAHRAKWKRTPPACMGAGQMVRPSQATNVVNEIDRPAGSVHVPDVDVANPEVPKPPRLVPIYPSPELCPKFRRKHDVAVVTLAHNQDGEDWLRVSLPTFQRYAERCHADLIVIRGQHQQYIHAEKFRARHVLTQRGYQHDRLIYLDADVLVHPDADCLFDVVPAGHVGLRPEGHLYDGDWYERETRELLATQGIDWPADKPLPLAHNAGLYVIDREHADALLPPARPIPGKWCDEQSWFNFQVHQRGFPVHPLTDRHHWVWYYDRHRSPADDAQFVHFAGARVSAGLNKADLMRQQLARWSG